MIGRILSYIVNYLTFPGVVIHELAHKIFCEQFGVVVFRVSYFRFGNPIGYVTHETPANLRAALGISMGPLFINSAAALGFSYLATYFSAGDYWKWILLWIGFSAGIHAFPSDADIRNVVAGRKGIVGFIGYIIAFPFLSLLRLANRLKPYGFDLIYATFLVYIGGGF